jgi:hypothetical protein
VVVMMKLKYGLAGCFVFSWQFIEQIDNYLPEDHPAREDEKLTQLQKLALPFAL